MVLKNNLFTSLILGAVFFVFAVLTLPHYGINWDTINHLPRGQAYLHYFLTGNKNFQDLEPWMDYYQNPDSLVIDANIPKEQVPKRSLYESDATPFFWFMEHDGKGHPPLSDILSALFNNVLFKHLRLINDIDAYRVYGIFLSSILVGLLYYWGSRIYGRFAGLIASLSLSLYPLFWSESHFNTEKDIPEAAFWYFFIFSIWLGFTKKSLKSIMLAGVFFGLALGTKFNILFAPLVILPWLIVYFLFSYMKLDITKIFKDNWKVLTASFSIPLIGLFIFIASWPYLWPDPFSRIQRVIGFYKTIGTTNYLNPQFTTYFNINTYPIKWILYTTPLIILFLSTAGLIALIFRLFKEKDKVSLLLLLCLVIPIARVSMPGTTIYGGIRQIMEYIPALALFAGLGAQSILDFSTIYLRSKKRAYLKSEKSFFSKKKTLVIFLILLGFMPITIKLINIHPNENAYFNPLINGLKGAKEENIPAWGNTFGAAYRQAFSWINKYAEPNSKVVFTFELAPNIPRIFLRHDLTLQNRNRSGYLMLGEYAVTLNQQGVVTRSYYDAYLENFQESVYQSAVDGIAVVKVWKNDKSNLKRLVEEKIEQDVLMTKNDFGIEFKLPEKRKMWRLEIQYDEQNCEPLKMGGVDVFQNGSWHRLPGNIPKDWLVSILGPQPYTGNFIWPFSGEEINSFRLLLQPKDTCLANISDLKIIYIE